MDSQFSLADLKTELNTEPQNMESVKCLRNTTMTNVAHNKNVTATGTTHDLNVCDWKRSRL